MKKVPLSSIYLKVQSHEILLERGFESLLCLDTIPITPKHWQIETALKALRDMQGSALLADEVGLGKTIEAGLIIKELFHRNLIQNVLIMVPAPLIEQWKKELEEKFLLTATELKQLKENQWHKTNIIISSLQYPIRSKKRKEELLTRPFDLVIVDEAHSLKNHQTAFYKFVYQLKRKNTILLSATPLQNDMIEIYNLINILKPGYLKSRRWFKKQYMIDRFTPKNVKKLKALLNDVMIRHRRSNTLTELPLRRLTNMEIRLSPLETQFHHGVIDLCKQIYHQYDQKTLGMITLILLLRENASSPAAVVSTLKKSIYPKLEREEQKECQKLITLGEQITVTSKMEQLCEAILQSSEQCIVYSEFQSTIQAIESYLTSKGIKVVTFTGSLQAKEKEAALTQFKEQKAQVFLSSEAGGQGINLQFCHILYHFDLPWNPMKIEQRIGRVHRFGQKQEVSIFTMPTIGTIDEYLLYVLTSKINLFEMIVGELDAVLSYMKEAETSLETTIGRIILESQSSEEVERKLKMIGELFISARDALHENERNTSAILDQIGVETIED